MKKFSLFFCFVLIILSIFYLGCNSDNKQIVENNSEDTSTTITVRFLNYDGTVLEKNENDTEFLPSYKGKEPTRDDDETYFYYFNGWDKEIVVAKTSCDYTAVYSSQKKYTITIERITGSFDYIYFCEKNKEDSLKQIKLSNSTVRKLKWNIDIPTELELKDYYFKEEALNDYPGPF